LFSGYLLELKNNQKTTEQNKDIFRIVKISDSINIDYSGLKLSKIDIFCKNNLNSLYFKTSMYRETLYLDKPLEFSITFDEKLLEDFSKKNNNLPFNSVDDLLNSVNEFSLDCWNAEKEFLNNAQSVNDLLVKDFYKKTEIPNFRIGWGSGLLGTSIFMLLDESLQKEIRNKLFVNRTDDIAPKSRRFVVDENNQPVYPLGWCKLERV